MPTSPTMIVDLLISSYNLVTFCFICKRNCIIIYVIYIIT